MSFFERMGPNFLEDLLPNPQMDSFTAPVFIYSISCSQSVIDIFEYPEYSKKLVAQAKSIAYYLNDYSSTSNYLVYNLHILTSETSVEEEIEDGVEYECAANLHGGEFKGWMDHDGKLCIGTHLPGSNQAGEEPICYKKLRNLTSEEIDMYEFYGSY